MVQLAVISKSDWHDLVEDYLLHVAATKKPRTAFSYRAQLRLFQRQEDARGVKPQTFRIRDMDAYLVFRQASGVSKKTQRYDAVIIKAMLTYAVQTGLLERHPLKDYKIPRVADREEYCPTVEEVRTLLSSVQDRWNTSLNPKCRHVAAEERRFYRLRDYAIITGLLATGMRITEMLSLTIADVDVAEGVAKVRESKTNDFRHVPFTATWSGCLAEWRKVRPKCSNDLLFVSAYGDPMNCNRFGASFRIYRRLAGLSEEFSCHSCRHYAITALCETDIKAAQGIAGHKSLATTNLYSHSREEHKKLKMAEADPLGKILVNRRTEQQKESKARREKLVKK